jgi:hypothetical protein
MKLLMVAAMVMVVVLLLQELAAGERRARPVDGRGDRAALACGDERCQRQSRRTAFCECGESVSCVMYD